MMKSAKPSFVFFGSGPVAAKSLSLLAHDFIVEAVVTKPTTEQEMGWVAKGVPIYSASDKHELDVLFATEKVYF